MVNLYCLLTLRFSLSLFLGKYLEAQKHYYYPGLREQFRFPPAKREIAEELPLMTEIEQEERRTVKDRMSKESGFLGVSLLHRLHKLYKFDIIKDLVFDIMHLVPLNLVKRRFEHLLSNSLLDPEQLQLALKKVPWTQGILKSCLAISSINQLLIDKHLLQIVAEVLRIFLSAKIDLRYQQHNYCFFPCLPKNQYQNNTAMFNIILFFNYRAIE